MRTVEDHLVACISVDSGHDTALDRSVIVKSLSHRSKTVCCAGSSGNNSIVLSKSVLVYGEYNSLKVAACGSGDNNFLCACVDMSLGLLLGAVEACALENNVNVKLSPGKLVSLSHSVDLKGLAVNCDSTCLVVSGNCVKILADASAVTALSGIVLEKLSQHGGLCEVVDSYDLVTLCAEHLTERETTDTSETIDCNFNCHNRIPPKRNLDLRLSRKKRFPCGDNSIYLF